MENATKIKEAQEIASTASPEKAMTLEEARVLLRDTLRETNRFIRQFELFGHQFPEVQKLIEANVHDHQKEMPSMDVLKNVLFKASILAVTAENVKRVSADLLNRTAQIMNVIIAIKAEENKDADL